MKLPEFIFIDKVQGVYGSGVILSTKNNLILATVHKYKNEDISLYNAAKEKKSPYTFAEIEGYNIIICYLCNLHLNNLHPVTMENELKKMAAWYFNEKILPNNTKYYNRFKSKVINFVP